MVYLIIYKKKGIQKTIDLINGKIRTVKMYNQILNLLKYDFFKPEEIISFKINLDSNIENPWFSGFSDANANFTIKTLNSSILFNFYIYFKDKNVLLLLKYFFEGNVEYIKDQNTYYYHITNIKSANNIINYFDRFHLLSLKHVNYIKWRKAYIVYKLSNYNNKYMKIRKMKDTIEKKLKIVI